MKQPKKVERESYEYERDQHAMFRRVTADLVAGTVEWIACAGDENEWYRYAVIAPTAAHGGILLREFSCVGQSPDYAVSYLESDRARVSSGRGLNWETEPVGKCVEWAHRKQYGIA